MKTSFLFPNRFKKLGWLFLLSGIGIMAYSLLWSTTFDFWNVTVFGIANGGILTPNTFFAPIQTGIGDELIILFLVCGSLLIGFSREREEDELIAKIRYESLVWSVYFNFAVLIFLTLFIYGLFYLYVMAINVFSLLIFFIIRFNLKLYQLKKSLGDDE